MGGPGKGLQIVRAAVSGMLVRWMLPGGYLPCGCLPARLGKRFAAGWHNNVAASRKRTVLVLPCAVDFVIC